MTGETTWEYPDWKHWSTEHKRYYYIDPETKETTWDLPEKYSWQELIDSEDTGETYYHNTKTGVSEREYLALSLSLFLCPDRLTLLLTVI